MEQDRSRGISASPSSEGSGTGCTQRHGWARLPRTLLWACQPGRSWRRLWTGWDWAGQGGEQRGGKSRGEEGKGGEQIRREGEGRGEQERAVEGRGGEDKAEEGSREQGQEAGRRKGSGGEGSRAEEGRGVQQRRRVEGKDGRAQSRAVEGRGGEGRALQCQPLAGRKAGHSMACAPWRPGFLPCTCLRGLWFPWWPARWTQGC